MTLGCASSTPPSRAHEVAPPPRAPSTPADELARAWRYHVSVDEALETLTTTLCFDEGRSSTLIPGQSFAYRFLRDAALVVDGAPPRALRVTPDGIELPADVERPCVRYRVDLAAAADIGDRAVARRVGKDVVVTHDVWIWRPTRYADEPTIRARFSLPPSVAVSSPWRASEGEGEGVLDVPRSTLRRRGYTAFGRFTVRELSVPGGTLHVTVLDGPLDNGQAPVFDWLSRAGRSVATLYGRFPREHTQVLVQPSPVGTGVRFGWVVRGGGPSVNLIVGRWVDEQSLSLDDEWIAVHEMSHLAIPFVSLGEPWLSEGLATWYQNVLRARAGVISEREAWAELLDGFERGRSSITGKTLLEDSADMFETANFWRVYWAGTALVMLADVEIRRATGGARSLDGALHALSHCCLDTNLTLDALELVDRIDDVVGQPVFGDIARAGRADRRFPDTDGVLRALGVLDVRGRLALDDRAPLAHIRRQIMAPPADVAE